MTAIDSAGLDRKALAARGVDVVLKMILVDGFFHADPHPGNVMYLPGNRIALIDFGMVGRLSPARRQQIVDPLTAMLFSAAADGEGLSQDACAYTLPIFDGNHRYDLKLAFKRMDRVTAEKGYAGPVVVCSVSYEPIAGHRPSTPLVKYLSEGREIEIALAPVAGTRLLAPFRVSVVSMLANLVIDANRFEATAQPASTVADPKPQ